MLTTQGFWIANGVLYGLMYLYIYRCDHLSPSFIPQDVPIHTHTLK